MFLDVGAFMEELWRMREKMANFLEGSISKLDILPVAVAESVVR